MTFSQTNALSCFCLQVASANGHKAVEMELQKFHGVCSLVEQIEGTVRLDGVNYQHCYFSTFENLGKLHFKLIMNDAYCWLKTFLLPEVNETMFRLSLVAASRQEG